MSKSIDEKYTAVGKIINKAGGTPTRLSDTAIEILKIIVEEKYLDFLMAFKKKTSLTMDQLKESLIAINLELTDDEIKEIGSTLAKNGIMFNQPSSNGTMIYRVLPFWNVGIFEYVFMGGGWAGGDEKVNKKLASLFSQLNKESVNFIQSNYDAVVSGMDKMPAPDRTVPIRTNKDGDEIEIVVNNELEVPQEWIVPVQEIDKIIEKFDEIAVAHCFCRFHEHLDHEGEGQSCAQVDPNDENCFTFGKSARHVAENGFGRMITKEEARQIMRDSESAGLIHKAYHPRFDITRDETSVCNCCSDCCGNSAKKGKFPIVNASMFLAVVDEDMCVGCGTCVEKCPHKAIYLENDKAVRIEEKCIGCGVCAYFCPEQAIKLVQSPRIVRIPPKRLS